MIEPCHGLRHNSGPADSIRLICGSEATPVGLPATICCEPRQARKGAAATTDSGAGERWAGVATNSSVIITRRCFVLTEMMGFKNTGRTFFDGWSGTYAIVVCSRQTRENQEVPYELSGIGPKVAPAYV